jgi:hypothetical protein
MATTGELTVQQREIIFEDMDAVTQEAAQLGLGKIKTGAAVNVLVAYDLGAIVDTVYEAEHLDDKQKKDEITKLSAYWNQPNLNRQTLYDLRNVSATFDREFVKAQVEERMSNGNYLTWSHFKELQKIGGEKRQLSTLKKIRQHCWSANELALELQGKKQAEVKRSGGRKPTLPKTPNGMLQKLFTSIQQTDNYVSAITEPVQSLFMEMPAEDYDEQFVENIDNTLARMEEATTHLNEMREALNQVKTRANTVRSSSESDAAQYAVAAKKSTDDLLEGEVEHIAVPTTKKRGRPRRSDETSKSGKIAPQGKRRRGRPSKTTSKVETPSGGVSELDSDWEIVD